MLLLQLPECNEKLRLRTMLSKSPSFQDQEAGLNVQFSLPAVAWDNASPGHVTPEASLEPSQHPT